MGISADPSATVSPPKDADDLELGAQARQAVAPHRIGDPCGSVLHQAHPDPSADDDAFGVGQVDDAQRRAERLHNPVDDGASVSLSAAASSAPIACHPEPSKEPPRICHSARIASAPR
jgi:hypothetical protein